MDLTNALQFTTAADALRKADDFDTFCANLPHVDLTKTYGAGNYASRFPLIWALSARDRPLERVQLMLAAGAPADLKTRLGETILHEMAAMKRKAAIRLPILRLLIFKGASLEATTIYKQTPLTVAIEKGSAENVAHFLIAGAKVRQVDIKAASYHPKKLKLMLDHLADNTAGLHEAAQIGGWLRGEIKSREQHARDSLQAGGKGQFYARMLDALNQSLAMLAALPDFPAGDAIRNVTWQQEPAAFLDIQNAPTLVGFRQALSRVDITTFQSNGTHPIYWPIEAKEDRPARLWAMIAAGASVHGGANGTALHIFAENPRTNPSEQYRMAQMLVQAGGDLEALNYENRSPLSHAVARGAYVEAAALLQLGASPNVGLSSRHLFGDRYTKPLIFAAATDVRIFKALLKIGVDAAANADGRDKIRAFIVPEILRLTEMQRETNNSGAIQKWIKRVLLNLTKSLAVLDKM